MANTLRDIQQGVSGWTIEDATLMDRLLVHPLQQQGKLTPLPSPS